MLPFDGPLWCSIIKALIGVSPINLKKWGG